MSDERRIGYTIMWASGRAGGRARREHVWYSTGKVGCLLLGICSSYNLKKKE